VKSRETAYHENSKQFLDCSDFRIILIDIPDQPRARSGETK
jgi:hypothetical protein